jgi:hypothetical protein
MALILKQFKNKTGEINFPALFHVKSEERLPALYEKDFMRATALVVGALTMAFEKLRFKKMDGVLVNNIAEEILNSCDEDNLSLEDLVLFLQNMVRGKYGNIEEITISKFMNLFDKYRDERTEAINEIRMNEHIQFKGLGDNTRTSTPDPISQHLSNISGTIADLKDSLRESKKETAVLRRMDNL